MPAIPVMHPRAATRQALRRGLPRRGYRLIPCRAPARVESALQRELVDAVVVDVVTAPADWAFELMERFPRIPVFALSRFRPADGRLALQYRRAGCRDTLVEGLDDAAAGELVARRTASARRRAALGAAPRMLRLTEPIQLRAWREVLRRAGTPTTTADVADALGLTREHLSREFGAGGAPNLKRVIDLARTVWAADLLANPGYTVTAVAGLLGYTSASHLAASARRVAGVAPRELASLPLHAVLDRFRRGRMRSRL
jgi:AraC-like DNA-binding protein